MKKEKSKYPDLTDRELLEKLYYRAGWILFWAILAALSTGYHY